MGKEFSMFFILSMTSHSMSVTIVGIPNQTFAIIVKTIFRKHIGEQINLTVSTTFPILTKDMRKHLTVRTSFHDVKIAMKVGRTTIHTIMICETEIMSQNFYGQLLIDFRYWETIRGG